MKTILQILEWVVWMAVAAGCWFVPWWAFYQLDFSEQWWSIPTAILLLHLWAGGTWAFLGLARTIWKNDGGKK